MKAGSVTPTPGGRTITSLTVWPSVLIARRLTSAFGEFTDRLDCTPTSTARASVGVICSIGLPSRVARDSRNLWMSRSTPSLPALCFGIRGLLGLDVSIDREAYG